MVHPRRLGQAGAAAGLLLLGLALGRGLASGPGPDACGLCHPMRRYVDSTRLSGDMDHAHLRAGVSCLDCHSGYSWARRAGTALAYLAGGSPRALARRRFGDEACNRCHAGMAHLAAQTDFLRRNPHLSHWPELRCGDCHVAHGRQVDFCSGCHDNGGQRMTGDPVVPRVANPWASVR